MPPVSLALTPSGFCPNYPAEIPLVEATCDLHDFPNPKVNCQCPFTCWSQPLVTSHSRNPFYLTTVMPHCPDFCPPHRLLLLHCQCPFTTLLSHLGSLFYLRSHPRGLSQSLGFNYDFYWWLLNFYLQPSPFPSPRLANLFLSWYSLS